MKLGAVHGLLRRPGRLSTSVRADASRRTNRGAIASPCPSALRAVEQAAEADAPSGGQSRLLSHGLSAPRLDR
jgi:hypothetical protein